MRITRSTFGAVAGCALALLAAESTLAQQAAPQHHVPGHNPPGHHNPPGNRPPGRPPHGHDRSNIPPRPNPNPPGQEKKGGPSAAALPGGSATTIEAAAGPAGPAMVSPAALANGRWAGIAGALRQGTLARPTGAALPAAEQSAVYRLLSAGEVEEPALVNALASRGNEAGREPAAALVRELRGLLLAPERLPAAVAAYNALVDASPDAYLSDPPAELLLLQTVLAELVATATSAQ